MDGTRPGGTDHRLYTAAQVRRLDEHAIREAGIPGIELMERAGRAAFDTIQARYPHCRRWLVLCGGGNNGGDGYVVARLARERGIECTLCALKPPEALHGDAATVAARWLESGGSADPALPPDTSGFDLVVDALLGTGLDRAPEGEYADAVRLINRAAAVVVAVDIPSGLDSDSGCVRDGLAVEADLTVTFIGRKRGLYTADGPDFAGEVQFSMLDVPLSILDSIVDYGILIREDVIEQSLPPRRRNSHKGSYGRLLGVGGNRGMGGALRLCGEAALRGGAGLVTLATHPDHAAVLNLSCPELIVRSTRKGRQLTSLLAASDVLVLGTGLGQTAWSRGVFEACRDAALPVVLDADGLNLLAQVGQPLPPGPERVLTPHPAEAGRLLGKTAREVQADRVGAAQELASRNRGVVVLKGCGTVVAEAGGRYAICPLGNPGMASAGTGDVLAGVIGALLAQGLDAWQAAIAGVVAHAAAGDLAAGDLGQRGLLASDIIRRLPAVLNPA